VERTTDVEMEMQASLRLEAMMVSQAEATMAVLSAKEMLASA